MYLYETIQALSESDFYNDGNKFEIINYDACVMGNVEMIVALSSFTDYYIGAAEEEPVYGQYYTEWLNVIKDNPSMNGYEIGKKIADDYCNHAKKDGEWLWTLSVIDIKNFRERILPNLERISEILISEAGTKNPVNNYYNFYDELYSIGAAYEYAKDIQIDLYDFGNFMGALSCIQTEDDIATPDEIKSCINKYTQYSLNILNALNDRDNSSDDVIYYANKWAKNTPANGRNVRDLNGRLFKADIEEGSTNASGLNIFFPTDNIYRVSDYVYYMSMAADMMPDGAEKTFMNNYISAIAYYGIISSVCHVVTSMINDGDTDITYDDVKSALDDDYIWEDFYGVAEYLIQKGSFASDSDVRNYISDIISQVVSETLTAENISAKQVRDTEGNIKGYKVFLSDVSPHSLGSIFNCFDVSVAPNDLCFKMNLSYYDYSYVQRNRYFPDGFGYTSDYNNGERDYSSYILDYYDDKDVIYQRAIADDSSVFDMKDLKKTIFVVVDDEGLYKPAKVMFTNNEHTEAYIPILVQNDYHIYYYYYLYISLQDGEWRIDGISSNIASSGERNYISMDEIPPYDYESNYTTVSEMTDVSGYTVTLPLSNCSTADASKEYFGMSVREIELNEMPEGTSTENMYMITDLFGGKVLFSDLISKAGLDAENGDFITDLSTADVLVAEAVYNGDKQQPDVTVKIGDNTLTCGTDYRVLYDGSKDVGEAKLMVIGMGRYTGIIYADYVITDAGIAPVTIKVTNHAGEPVKDCGIKITDSDEVLYTGEDGTVSVKLAYGDYSYMVTETPALYKADDTAYPFTISRENVGGIVLTAVVHTPSDAVVENEIPAGCEEGGSFDEVVYCGECSTELAREHISTDALGHNLSFVAEVHPTKTEAGCRAHYKCLRCGELFEDADGKIKIADPSSLIISPMDEEETQQESSEEYSEPETEAPQESTESESEPETEQQTKDVEPVTQPQTQPQSQSVEPVTQPQSQPHGGNTPSTGDNHSVALYLMLIMMSVVVFGVVNKRRAYRK